MIERPSKDIDKIESLEGKVHPVLYAVLKRLQAYFSADPLIDVALYHDVHVVFRKSMGEADFYLELDLAVTEDIPDVLVIQDIRTEPMLGGVTSRPIESVGSGSNALRVIESTVRLMKNKHNFSGIIAREVLPQARGFWGKMDYHRLNDYANDYYKEV